MVKDKMICENCGKDSNSGLVYKRRIFCSHNCRDEYYKVKNKKKGFKENG